jgi:osmotically-inducible protein OsmY
LQYCHAFNGSYRSAIVVKRSAEKFSAEAASKCTLSAACSDTRRRKVKLLPSITTKSDLELKNDVLAELKYEPSVQVSDIGVLVNDGAVTLHGYANSYGEKRNAVTAAGRVGGVQVLVDEIEVKLPTSMRLSDTDVAAAVAHQLRASTMIPAGMVRASVKNGWVTLEGEVEWWYQKNAAETSVRYLAGVEGVMDLISLKAKVAPLDVAALIKAAFQRSASLDAEKISIDTLGTKVTLRGTVRTQSERDEAGRAAWAAAGIFAVDNQLKVEWFWNN